MLSIITLLITTTLVIATVGYSTNTAAYYNLRGSPRQQADNKLLLELLHTHTDSVHSSPLLSARKTNEIVNLIEYQSDVKYTVSLRVFLFGRSILLNDKEKSTFELAALKFIGGADHDIALKSIGNIVFTDQKLTWSRLVGAGLQVSFQGDATVPYKITQDAITREIQDLFESEAEAFQALFDQLLKNEESKYEPEPTVVLSLESIRVPLGIASAIAGCVTLLFIVILSMCYTKKKKDDEDTKNLSKSSIEDDEEKVANPIPPQNSFPVQQINNTRTSFVDSDEDLTYDDDFDVNLNPDSQVKTEPKDASALFECNQSAILADIENNTDSDLSSDEEVGEIIEDHTHYEYSPIQKGGKLTLEELDAFDDAVRRCEC